MFSEFKARAARWLLNPRERFLDAVALLILGYLLYTGLQLMQHAAPGYVLLLCVIFFVLLRLFWEMVANRNGVPTVASSFFERQKIAEIIEADVARHSADYTLIDIGSGAGELTRHMARRLPKARVIGIENAPAPYWHSKLLATLFGLRNLEYRREDFLAYDFSKADAVMLYLNPIWAERVGVILRQKLKPGALVVSNSFALNGDWEPVESFTPQSLFKTPIFVYRQVPSAAK